MNYYISFPHAEFVYEDSWKLIDKLGGGRIEVGSYYEGTGILPKLKRNLSLLLGLIRFKSRRFHEEDGIFVLIPYNLPLQPIFYKALLAKKASLYLVMKELMRRSVAEWCQKIRTGSERLEQMRQLIE